MSRILIAIAACAALSTLADSNSPTGRPGFFKPTPDGNSSISRIVPPPDPAVPDTTQTLPENVPLAAAVQSPADKRVKEAEPEMDRADREHREMAQRSAQATPIAPGAYNGATSERDR